MRFIAKLIPVKGRIEENTRNFLYKCDKHISPTKDIDILLNDGSDRDGTFAQVPCAHVNFIYNATKV